MPIYEYKCEQTGKVYEVKQKINDQPFEYCQRPACECGGKSKTHRIISKNVGLIFNGSGFYETDYKHSHESAPSVTHPTGCGCCSQAESCPTAQADAS